ncbi:hypothetical protein PENANT_c007G11047 [Penicillium antarcticum]|uniref:Uncharacterized protein n=1 Tax=Penicillium antarcticum TaxID=416450 RepID=A0A1V6QC29_9EURO|nr:hypothetical protein PENANT_c007G11047 [Penicillium antarcticum]
MPLGNTPLSNGHGVPDDGPLRYDSESIAEADAIATQEETRVEQAVKTALLA